MPIKRPPNPVEFSPPQLKRAPKQQPKKIPMPELDIGGFGAPADNIREREPRRVPRDTDIRRLRRPAVYAPKKRPANPPPQARRRRRPMRMPRINQRLASLVVGVIVLAAFAISGLLIVRSITNYNAFAVYLGGRHMGYINYIADLTSEAFHNSAVVRLESQRGSQVSVNEIVTITATRAPVADRLLRAEMELRLAAGFTYHIAAVAIYVNNEREVLLRSQRESDQVRIALTEGFTTDYTTHVDFVQPVRFVTQMVDSTFEDFDTVQNSIFRLTRNTGQHYAYTVRDGDTLGSIAGYFGGEATVTRIMDDNGLTSHIIHPNWVLQIYRQLPLLSIITYDDIVTEMAAPMETQTVENEQLALAQQNIVSPGRPGTQRTTVRIVRIDGVEVERRYLDPEIIEAPVAEIIEVGTGEPQLDIRN